MWCALLLFCLRPRLRGSAQRACRSAAELVDGHAVRRVRADLRPWLPEPVSVREVDDFDAVLERCAAADDESSGAADPCARARARSLSRSRARCSPQRG